MRSWEEDRYGGDDGEGGEGDQAKPGIITINLRGIYTAPCVMILMRGIDIMRAIGRVVLKVSPVLGPGIAWAYGAV